MRDLRTIFKDAVKFYNKKEKGIEIIKHYQMYLWKIIVGNTIDQNIFPGYDQ